MKKKNKKWQLKKTFLKVRHNFYYNPFSKGNEHYSLITFSENGFGIVVPITSKNEIVFIEQYRPGVDKFVLNLPSGRFDKEKTLLQKIKRIKKELEEEVGFSTNISNFKKIGEFLLGPARISDMGIIFVAKKVFKIKGKRLLESAEKGSRVVKKDFKEVIKMINSGKIKDLATISAILLAKEKGLV